MKRVWLLVLSLVGACAVPADWGASAVLRPGRRHGVTPPQAEPFAVEREGVTLRGWLVRARPGRKRGLLVWLHGAGDDKASGAGLAARYAARGFDVAAFDARAHG